MDAAGRKLPSDASRRAAPARIAGATMLGVSAVLTGVGTALPWLTETAVLPVRHRATLETPFTAPGVSFGNGWIVVLAAVLLAALAVSAALVRRPRFDWLVLVPVVIGGLALGDWLGALNVGGAEVPAGVPVSLTGILLATPATAILRRGRASGRLAIAAATLVATGVALLLGVLFYSVAPITVYRAF